MFTACKKIFWFSKTEQINTIKIIKIQQLKDEFRTPSWSLVVKTSNSKVKNIYLVSHQPIEVSDLLGKLLADRYQIEFIPAN